MTRREEWQKRVTEFRASGQSVKAWCEAHGIKRKRMYHWLRELPASPASEVAPSQWLPVAVSGDQRQVPESDLVIRVGDATVEVRPGFDPALLADVMRVLMAPC